MKNQNGMSLISVMIALGVASLLALLLAQLNVIMVRNNTTAMANSDIIAYTNQLRGNIQYLANSSAALAGNSFTGTDIVLKDPLTGAVVAGPNFKQQPNDAWKIKNLRFDNVVSVPSQVNLYRGTLIAVIELDVKRIIGSSIKTKTIGDVYCLATSGVIQSCYGSTDLTTMAQSNCAALGGSWNASKPFGSQCAIPLPIMPTTKNLSFDADPLVCENFPVNITCPASQKIVIVESSYGKNCGVAENYGLQTVQALCNGTANCSFTAGNNNNCTNQGVFVDPAVGCAKAYHMSYYCS